jgi:serine/threonine protein phosphatase PrpC
MVKVKVGVFMDIWTITGKGGREENRDSAGWTEKKGAICMVVCDGLGGYGNGRIAAEEAVGSFPEGFEKNPKADERNLRGIVEGCHKKLLEPGIRHNGKKGAMTTLAAVVAKDGVIKACHIGDTRIYVFEKGCLAYRSRDHSPGQALASFGSISAGEIRKTPYRNKLFRVLGGGKETPACEIAKIGTAAGYAVLVCTDGFWEYVLEDEMEKLHGKSVSAKEWLLEMEELLKLRSGDGGDNYTATALVVERF